MDGMVLYVLLLTTTTFFFFSLSEWALESAVLESIFPSIHGLEFFTTRSSCFFIINNIIE